MDETNTIPKRHVLQIEFKNLSSVSSIALRDRIPYEVLDIIGMLRDTVATDNSSDFCEKFWQTVGSTVTELTFDKLYLSRGVKTESLLLLLKPIIDHLVCLKKLKLELCTLEIFSSIFSMQKKDIEIIEVCTYHGIDEQKQCLFAISEKTEEAESKNWEILPAFENLIKCFTSLKRISFTCNLPYHYASIIEPITHFSQKLLGADEVIFDMDSMSSNTNLFISAMDIEVSEQSELCDKIIKKSMVKSIDIVLGVHFLDEVDISETFCIFEHNICLNKLVRKMIMPIDIRNVCLLCFEYLIRSFPNITWWKPINRYLPLKSATIMLMSKHLPYFNRLSLEYSECLDSIPDFAQLKYLDICFDKDQTSAGFFHLCACCPNLEEFKFSFSYGDVCRSSIGTTVINGIVTHLKKLKVLEIDERVKIDSLGLKAIRTNLKQLTMLSFGCDENSVELLELLKELPLLERIDYCLNFARRKLTRESLNSLKSVDQINSRDAIDILPDELWAQVFQHLTIDEQVNCRSVCKQWWNVFNSFPLFRRLFRLRNCVLSMDTNPCKTFKNTHFNYNNLLLQGPIIICENDVNEFWCSIGRSINEIFIGKWMNVEKWLQLQNGGMMMRNFPALKSITFTDAKMFFELISKCCDTIGPMLKLLKGLVIHSFSDDMKYEIGVTDVDMPNLEYVQITGGCRWDSLKLFANWIGNCPMLCTLDLNNYRRSKSEIPSEFTAVFRKLKHLKINGTIDANEMEFLSNNCKILKTLTFQNLDSVLTQCISYHDGSRRNYHISEEMGFRNMAISLFQRLDSLTTVLFVGQAKVTFKYELETSCYTKNVVESKIAHHLLSQQVVHCLWSAQ